MEYLVEIIVTVGSIIGGGFGLVRYMASQNTKQQKQIMDFYEKKNGHMERMAQDFTSCVRENTAVVADLRTEIKILNSK